MTGKIMKNFKLSLHVLLLFILIGCTGKPESTGKPTDLFVVADKDVWEALEPTIKSTFERTIETPQPEKVFQVVWVPPDQFNTYATRKNLAIVGILESQGEMTAKIRGMLSADVRKKVEEGQEFAFKKDDPWAKGQVLLVLVSNSVPQLQQKMEQNQPYLYSILEDKLLNDTLKDMYETLEQKDLEQKLLDKYGWMVRIQHDYVLNVDRADKRFVMLRRSLPGTERWLFVHWIDSGDPATITEEWAIKTRNRLTQEFYQGDVINPQHVQSKEVDFLGRPALRLEGLWENVENVVGGPFRNYSFYDEASGRIYMIDLAVFHPAGEKEEFLRQLDVMAHTFRTKDEILEHETKEES